MKLFKLVDNLPVPSEEALLIKEFKKLITRDRTRDKSLGLKELGFVYYYCSFDTRFDAYRTEEERVEAIKTVLGLKEDWEIDSDLKLALERFSDMMITESLVLVQKMKNGIKKMEDFIDDLDLTERNKSENYVFSAKDLQAVIKEMPNTIRALNEAKSIVEKELQDKFNTSTKTSKSLINRFTQDSTGEI